MKLETVKKLSAVHFRRIIGIKKETFEEMIKIVTEAMIKKKVQGGRPNKLDIPTMVLMTMEYLREYRTYAAIALSYGLSESNAYKTIRWVEDVLIKCDQFKLLGKKALQDSKNEFEIIVVDVTETPVERPKKNKKIITQVKRKNIR